MDCIEKIYELVYSVKHKKYLLFPAGIVLFLSTVAWFFSYQNSFSSQVKDLHLPSIPDKIKSYLDIQHPSLGNNGIDFEWFTYYDPETRSKVKVKYSGWGSSHHHSPLNRTMTYRFDGDEYRLKSFGSEVVTSPYFDSPFEMIFSEHIAYTIAKRYTKYSPKSKIVSVNEDRKDLRIQWKDDIPNAVRENLNIDWTAVAKTYLYAKDKAARFFDSQWKTRQDETDGRLETEFTALLEPFLLATVKGLDEPIKTAFNEEDVYTYLALASVFGSQHINDHNLFFQATENWTYENQPNLLWHPVIYDLMGYWANESRNVSIFTNHNYISEYFLRNPEHYYHYLQELSRLNDEILGDREISQVYGDYDCDSVGGYPQFGEILKESGSSLELPGDLNGYCLAVEKMKNYDAIRHTHISEQLANASLRWFVGIPEKKDGRGRLYLWASASIPVKIESIHCGLSDCTGDWELVNQPWWHFDPAIISPQMVRINSAMTGREDGTSVIPQPYIYSYKWTGKPEKYPSPDEISFRVKNAVTGESISAILTGDPAMVVHTSTTPDDPYLHNLNLQIETPVGFEDKITHDGVLNDASGWSVVASSRTCMKKTETFPNYSFDCSAINIEQWPYVLDYSVDLYYKDTLIHSYKGEFFQNYRPPVEGYQLDMQRIQQYKVDAAFLKNIPYQNSLLVGLPEGSKKIMVQEMINSQTEIYYLGAGEKFEVTDDIILDKALLFIDHGAQLVFWPMVEMRAKVLVVNGYAGAQPVIFKKKEGMPGWNGISVLEGAYIKAAELSDGVNVEQGTLHGEDVKYLGLEYVNFQGNSNNLQCNNCTMDATNLKIDGGQWGLSSSNSVVNANTVDCHGLYYCYQSTDDLAVLQNTSASSLKSWVYDIEGPSSDVTIVNTQAENVPALLSLRGRPQVKYNFDAISANDTKLKVVDHDVQDIYNSIRTVSAENFAKEYKKYIEKRDESNPDKFYFKHKPPVIEKDLIIPESVSLVIQPGTKVRLARKASILSYGTLVAKGEPGKRIRFETADDENKPWGMVLIKGRNSHGVFDYVDMTNGNGDYLVGYDYTGTLTADETDDLVVTNSSFERNKNDDGLNCKYSKCIVMENVFIENSMDALDFDFANPASRIAGNRFFRNGNDAIDISFHQGTIEGNIVDGSGDKCISVGEGSKPVIFNNHLIGCNIGIQAKDSSEPVVINNTIEKNAIAIDAYQKKARFGIGGRVKAYNTDFIDNKELATNDSRSSVVITYGFDQAIINNYVKDVDSSSILYGIKE